MKYYICGNTSDGFCDFTLENIFDVKSAVKIKSSNKLITDKVLTAFCNDINKSCDMVIFPGSSDVKSGIISNGRKFAVVSVFDDADITLDLDQIFGITSHSVTVSENFEKMKESWKKAKEIHDAWEKIYISNMDFKRLDLFCEDVISRLSEKDSLNGNAKVYKRFFGTTTSEGNVNFIDNITKDLSERYFIKGRPGTGKSTFLKKLSKELTKKGFDIEQYYCSFDPHSLDMVISRELSIAVFDSTAPHEKFPESQRDIILDFYEESGLSGIDEKYTKELSEVKNAYDVMVKEGVSTLKDALKTENEENERKLLSVKEKDVKKAVELIREKTVF